MTNPDAIRQLHIALKRLAAALESGKPGAVLDAEAPLASALGLLSKIDKATLALDPRAPDALLDLRLSVARGVSRLQGPPGADERGLDYRAALSAVSSAERVSLLDYLNDARDRSR